MVRFLGDRRGTCAPTTAELLGACCEPSRSRHPGDIANDKRGNVAVAAAILAGPLLLSLGLALDTVNMARVKSHLRGALDAAAMEIAVHVNSGMSDAELETLGNTFLLANVRANGLTSGTPVLAYLGMSTESSGLQSLSAQVSYDYPRLIPWTIRHDEGTSTALLVDTRVSSTIGDGACIYALNKVAPRALEVSGSTTVTVDGCVLASNSIAADAVYVGGSASINADCVQTAGEIDADEGLVTDCAENREHAWRLPDPFAELVEPMPGILLADPKKSDTIVEPGRYRNLTLDGTKTLQPGIYYIDGFLAIKGDISGTGVTFFMADGGITVNGNASLSLSAPTSGNYAGMLFWSARTNTSPHVFNGNGATDLNGYLYFPSGAVSYQGNNGTMSNCLRIVADTVTLTGSSTMRSDCSAELGGREARVSGPLYYSK